jgi:hypothetical protein
VNPGPYLPFVFNISFSLMRETIPSSRAPMLAHLGNDVKDAMAIGRKEHSR